MESSYKIKNVNYETKNVSNFKEDNTNEIHGAFGFLELELIKKIGPESINRLTRKSQDMRRTNAKGSGVQDSMNQFFRLIDQMKIIIWKKA